MGAISASDLALLRTEKNTQSAELKLYGWGRPVMWSGLVNDLSITRGAQTIVFDTGAMVGDFAFADIVGDLLVLFGASQSDDSIGKARLLSISGAAASGTVIIEWNDNIELSDGDTITIIHDFVLGPRFSHFTAAPTVFLKDGPGAVAGGAGIVYSDQNSEPPPLVIMGRHAVKDITAEVNAWWLTPTVVPGDVIAAYQFIGANDADTAKWNLANKGTNDLVDIGTPTWAQATGFTFDGSSDALDTNLDATEEMTVLIRYTAKPKNNQTDHLFGLNKAGSNWYMSLTKAAAGDWTLSMAIGGMGAPGGATRAQVLDNDYVVGVKANGGASVRWGGDWALVSGGQTFAATTEDLFIGGRNDGVGGLGINPWEGDIQAVVIYNRGLTDVEAAAIETDMLALTSDTPPPGFLYVDASQSQAVATGAALSTFAWTFTPSGATGIFEDAAAAQTWFFPDQTQADRYYLHCAVTDSNSKVGTGHRKFIADDPEASEGYTEFARSPISERKGQVPVQASIAITSPDLTDTAAIRPQVTWSDFPDGGMVIITKKTIYNTTQKEISFQSGVQYIDRLNIDYCGLILQENDTQDASAGGGENELRLQTLPDRFMYSLSLTGILLPAAWYQMQSDLMYVAALLFHLFKWHTTFAENIDLYFDWTDTTKRSAVEFWTEGSLLSKAVATAVQNGRLMIVTGTAQGEIHVEHSANLLTTLTERNALTTTLTLDDKDVTGVARTREKKEPTISQIFMEGGSSAGVMGSWTPFRSISQVVRIPNAPPPAPSFRQLMVADQTELNRMSGRYLDVLNAEIEEILLSFSGEYGGIFSPADQQWTNTGTEVFAAAKLSNLRGRTDLNSIRMVPMQVTRSFNNSTGRESVDVVFEVEAPQGLIGVTVPIVILPPDYTQNNDVSTDIGIPAASVPSQFFVTGDLTNGIEVFDPVTLTWSARNTGLSTNAKKVHWLTISPYWWMVNQNSDVENAILWIATEDGIYTSWDFGQSWLDRTPTDDEFPASFLPSGVGAKDFVWVSVDVYGITTIIDATIAIQGIYEDAGTWITVNGLSTDRGYTWTLVEEDAGGSNEIKGLGLMLDKDAAGHLFVAYWDGTAEELFVGKRTTALAVSGADESFAAATEAEIDAETYRLEIYTRRDPSVTNHDEVTFALGDFQKV